MNLAKPVLISSVVVPGRALAAHDVDNPYGGALAVAVSGPNGWQVATSAGVIADRLDQRKAKALMLRTAKESLSRLAAPLLAGAAKASAVTVSTPMEVTTCPF